MSQAAARHRRRTTGVFGRGDCCLAAACALLSARPRRCRRTTGVFDVTVGHAAEVAMGGRGQWRFRGEPAADGPGGLDDQRQRCAGVAVWGAAYRVGVQVLRLPHGGARSPQLPGSNPVSRMWPGQGQGAVAPTQPWRLRPSRRGKRRRRGSRRGFQVWGAPRVASAGAAGRRRWPPPAARLPPNLLR